MICCCSKWYVHVEGNEIQVDYVVSGRSTYVSIE